MAGLYYEELEPGLVVDHSLRRTVAEYDNTLFSALTHNTAPLHLDEEYSRKTMWGQRLVNSMFTLSLVCGVIVAETTEGTTLGNLGFDGVKFPKPVFFGDTIRVRTEVIERRESSKYPNAGIVTFLHQGINQRDEVVCECRRVGMMIKKSHVAEAA
ncbi:MaoC family dehydratase [Sphingomonas sp. CL5.1]|uniref:MaoC family dehydratase n=1 Tax=Sphingomonas sp. CL5.1 TaxID=2653203 RepID=UPI0015822CED|nr:MaoC family dehydratase [Sphingomonas sp. CL5.1]QKS00608.1 MaoC family dehydratase [Sphingomonas sp. CL5.1]